MKYSQIIHSIGYRCCLQGTEK